MSHSSEQLRTLVERKRNLVEFVSLREIYGAGLAHRGGSRRRRKEEVRQSKRMDTPALGFNLPRLLENSGATQRVVENYVFLGLTKDARYLIAFRRSSTALPSYYLRFFDFGRHLSPAFSIHLTDVPKEPSVSVFENRGSRPLFVCLCMPSTYSEFAMIYGDESPPDMASGLVDIASPDLSFGGTVVSNQGEKSVVAARLFMFFRCTRSITVSISVSVWLFPSKSKQKPLHRHNVYPVPDSTAVLINTGTSLVALAVRLASDSDDSCGETQPKTSSLCVHRVTARTSASTRTSRATITLRSGCFSELGVEFVDRMGKLTRTDSAGWSDEVLVAETSLEYEPLLFKCASVKCKRLGVEFIGLCDYEVELTHCYSKTGGSTTTKADDECNEVEMLFTALIEIALPEDCSRLPQFLVFAVDVRWNWRLGIVQAVQLLTQSYSIVNRDGRFRIPKDWYPFASHPSLHRSLYEHVETLPLTNVPYLQGKSLKWFAAYFGSIFLFK